MRDSRHFLFFVALGLFSVAPLDAQPGAAAVPAAGTAGDSAAWGPVCA